MAQPISASWIQSPSERDRAALLEYTRGVLYGLSFSGFSGQRAQPIHVGRVRSAFSNLGATNIYRLGLKLAHLLGEAERVFGGYWLLAPFRVVQVGDDLAFIGSLPSLSRHLGEVRYHGMARFISQDVAAGFPRQALVDWMGGAAKSPKQEVSAFVSNHEQFGAAAVGAEGVEFLHLVENNSRRRFAWKAIPREILPNSRLALCRHNHAGSLRHFSGELRQNLLVREAPITQSLTRLMFALASENDHPVPVTAKSQGSFTFVEIPERLPLPEYRLALLLANNVSRNGSSTVYSFSSQLASAFLMQIKIIGCSLETTN